MKTKLPLILSLLLFIALSAMAQYRYSLHDLLPGGTTATHAANTESNYAVAADVGPTHWADVQVTFSLVSSNTLTNNVVLVLDSGIDNENWRDSQSITSVADGTNIVCDLFRIPVTNDAWLRLYSLTNHNADMLTNLSVRIGGKWGL